LGTRQLKSDLGLVLNHQVQREQHRHQGFFGVVRRIAALSRQLDINRERINPFSPFPDVVSDSSASASVKAMRTSESWESNSRRAPEGAWGE
jgi:hypothetical protein